MRKALFPVVVVLMLLMSACKQKLPNGYLGLDESQAILDKTATIRLDPDVSQLSPPEQQTVALLLEAGQILHDLYLESRHHQALESRAALVALDTKLGHPVATQNLLDLYRLYKGPVGRNLEGKVQTILPVDYRTPGRNVYPWGIEKKEIESYLERHPDERESLLAVRTVVRRSSRENLERDLATLDHSPMLQAWHPGLKERWEELLSRGETDGFYAVPYSVAYSEQLTKVRDILERAASTLEATDTAFSGFLRIRGDDLLRDDYERGDSAWVAGHFGNLNAQIGSYETYDDELYGVKSFFSLSLLVEDRVMSSSLRTVVKWLQEMEDMLPYDSHKKVRDDIPVGVYNVVADFGQARGTNTATILPNESHITRKYGRTILIRRNILQNSDLFAIRSSAFNAAVAEEYHGEYQPDGDFFRTLFHEIGHYLGPDRDKNGRTLDIALEEDSSILEELKSDLVSLFVCKNLFKRGYYTRERLRAVQSSGIRRVLLKNKPKKAQTYATMELMQMNYFLDEGLLDFDAQSGRLQINFGVYQRVVAKMLGEVLALQYNGDKAAADAFIDRYGTWRDDLHGRIAASMKEAETYRYALVRYAALGE